MRSPQHNTPPVGLTTLSDVMGWRAGLIQLHARLASHFARPEPFQRALRFVQGILSSVERKNGWQLAEQAREATPYGMQRLLSSAVWDADGVRDEIRTFALQQLGRQHVIAAIDETGFLKRGKHSAGLAKQYYGPTGDLRNCQVGVFSYVTARGHALIDRELYLPEDWCTDLPRRQAAHIPESVTFRTKPELGQQMIGRVQAAGLPIGWVVADTVYGHSPELRLFLEKQGYAYALAVPSTEVVCVQTRTGLLLSDVASIARQALRPRDWQRLSQSLGTKGERLFDWARLPVVHAGVADGRHWLVFRRCLDNPNELAYYLVSAPPNTPLSLMVQAIGARWHIEEDLQASKALGLDQYEVRSYLGWYRHLTLVLLAAAFLVGITVQSHFTAAARPTEPAICAALIPLTTSEARHLLAHLFWPTPTSAPLVCQWSLFRRTHQYWAGYYHRRRRKTSRVSLCVEPGFPSQHVSGEFSWEIAGTCSGKTPRSFPSRRVRLALVLLSLPNERSDPMTVVSVAQAAHRLGIDAKTLRRWLAQAQLPLHRHPQDGRKKGVSDEHLQALARLHQRRLAPCSPEPPAPVENLMPALPAPLLALPEQLDALQAQLASLQQQVVTLTHLLQPHAQEPAFPVAPAKLPRTTKRPPKPAPSAPRVRPAAQTSRKPVHVIPRVEYGKEGHYVVICPKRGVLPFEPDTPEWFAWVAKQDSFRFVGQGGHFTAHHEWRVPKGAWRAHRHIRNHVYIQRLAPNQELTIAVLEQVALALQAHLS